MGRKSGIIMSFVWGLAFCTIAVAGGAGVAFLKEMGMFKPEKKPVVLNATYSFSGALQEDQLHLSRTEIIALNRAAWRHRDRMNQTVIKISSENWTGPDDPDCPLEYSFQTRAEDGHVVEANLRRTTRKKLIKELERQLDVACGVLKRCHKKFPGFKIVYI
mgnify:CR=1 FL=1